MWYMAITGAIAIDQILYTGQIDKTLVIKVDSLYLATFSQVSKGTVSGVFAERYLCYNKQ